MGLGKMTLPVAGEENPEGRSEILKVLVIVEAGIEESDTAVRIESIVDFWTEASAVLTPLLAAVEDWEM